MGHDLAELNISAKLTADGERQALTAYEKLSPRQQRFVDEYLVDLNATQAYIRADYTGANPRVCACQVLARSNVHAAVAERRERRVRPTRIRSNRIF
jgi:phage terminase small subunit